MLSRSEDGKIHSLARQPFLAREDHVLIAESLIHEIDVVRALFGEVEVLACGAKRCKIGSAKAAVLPVPVCAPAIRSRPASTSGIACSCTGVAVL